MASARARLASGTAVFLLSAAPLTPALAQDLTLGDDSGYELGTIVLTAEEQIKQALGTSTITAADIEKQPVVNDVAEIIRKMPGVNLSGTSPSGQRGNQRQVDIRGMGPENVLILIDGKEPTDSQKSTTEASSDTRSAASQPFVWIATWLMPVFSRTALVCFTTHVMPVRCAISSRCTRPSWR